MVMLVDLKENKSRLLVLEFSGIHVEAPCLQSCVLSLITDLLVAK